MSSQTELRGQILSISWANITAQAFAPRPFVAGETPVPVSGRVFDAEDMRSLVDSSLDFWLTTGVSLRNSKSSSPDGSVSVPLRWSTPDRLPTCLPLPR